MSDDLSPVLALPLIQPAQAQKHVTHNEALRMLDVLVQPAVSSRSTATPPPFPAQGARFILPGGATGAWAGQDQAIALYDEEAWVFLTPLPGWQAHVLDEGRTAVFDGTGWATPADLAQRFPRLGVNADADAVNRLAVASEATLLSHAGAGHQLKINKATAAETASLLFQTGFSGRAELGTAGSDALAIKVSADGAAWVTALSLDPASGLASGTAVAAGATDATVGRLLRVGAGPLQLAASPALRVAVGGTMNARTLTSGAGFAAIPAGLMLRFRAPGANTGATTINLDGLGAQPCVTLTGAALPAGYIRTDADTVARWDGAAWVLDRTPETGVNANGRFLRLPCGTQVCHVTGLTWGDSAATGTGTLADPYRTVVSAWTFPASFSAAPVVTGMVRGDSNGVNRHHALSIRFCTATGISQAQAIRLTSAVTALTPAIDLTATGTWY